MTPATIARDQHVTDEMPYCGADSPCPSEALHCSHCICLSCWEIRIARERLADPGPDYSQIPFCTAIPPCGTLQGWAHCEHCECDEPTCQLLRDFADPTPPEAPEPAPAPELSPAWWTPPEAFVVTGEKRPAALSRDDGETILYAHCLNWVSGMWRCGKSWTALLAALNSARSLYWDFEDSARSMGERSALLGGLSHIQNDDLFRHATGYNLLHDYGDGQQAERSDFDEAVEWLGDGLLVIDTAGSAGCPMDGSDVRPWINEMVNPWRRNNATIIILDHIPKRAEGRPAGPIGSQHKGSAADGVCLRVIGQPWNRSQGGHISLILEKDKHGDLPVTADKALATIRGSYDHNGAFAYSISAPQETGDEADDLQDRVLIAISACGDIGIVGTKGLVSAVKGSRNTVLLAAEALAHAGLITKTLQGKAWRYVITQRGRDLMEDS